MPLVAARPGLRVPGAWDPFEVAVRAVLGTPTESSSVNVLGVSGTVSRWVADDAVITVRFVNGKAALKSFDKPGEARK